MVMSELKSPSREGQTSMLLNQHLARFRRSPTAIPVSFRELVPWIRYNSERATHLVHHYPAKVIPHIPHYFLQNEVLSSKGDFVLDPFCGTGTVMVESLLANRRTAGADANPLARLIANVKCSPVAAPTLASLPGDFAAVLAKTTHRVIPDVVNLEYWFYPHVVDQLGQLLAAISQFTVPEVRNLLLVSFSGILRRVSLADPRISVPVRLRPERLTEKENIRGRAHARIRQLKRVSVVNEFFQTLNDNISRVKELGQQPESLGTLWNIYADAKQLTTADGLSSQRAKSVQLIITSPPYLGAQKYIRASSLSLGWLNLCGSDELRAHEQRSIGREHFYKEEYEVVMETGLPAADRLLRKVREKNPLRAHIAATYLLEMKAAISEMKRVLKPNGFLVLVAGSNLLCGRRFDTPAYLRQMAEAAKLRTRLVLVDAIPSRGLMTKRNRTAGVIPDESVIVLEN